MSNENNIKVAVDAGGSGTRIVYERGGKRYKRDFSSRVKSIPVDEPTQMDIEVKTDDFVIYGSNYEGRYLKGSAISDYMVGEVIQPTNQSLKSNQDITYINTLHAIANILLPLEGDGTYGVNIGLLIPAAEFCSASADTLNKIKDNLAGTYEVYYPVLKKSVKFKINKSDIITSGEGLIYTINLREDLRYRDVYRDGNGLIVDVGRRSVDITPIKRGLPLKAAVRSVPTGGILIESQLMAELEARQIFVGNDDIMEVVSTGKVNDVNVADAVIKSKKFLASKLYEDVVSTLAVAGLSVNNISYVVLMGQLFAEPDSAEGSTDYTGNMASYLSKQLNIKTVVKPTDTKFANVLSMFAACAAKWK